MNTHKIPFSMTKENHTKLYQICSQGIFSQGLKNEFETAVVNEPSVFEPLKFYSILIKGKIRFYSGTGERYRTGNNSAKIR